MTQYSHKLGEVSGCSCRRCGAASVLWTESLYTGMLPEEPPWTEELHLSLVQYRLGYIKHDLDPECSCKSCAAAEAIRKMYK